jgi:hypothetical protein
MARKRGFKTIGLSFAVPPDTRPIGPLVQENSHGWGGGSDHPLAGGAMYCSDVMADNGDSKDAAWANGIRTVTSQELARGSNPIRQRRGEEPGDKF